MLSFCDIWLTLLTFRQVIANYLNTVTCVHANGQATNEPLFVNNLDWISCYYPIVNYSKITDRNKPRLNIM